MRVRAGRSTVKDLMRTPKEVRRKKGKEKLKDKVEGRGKREKREENGKEEERTDGGGRIWERKKEEKKEEGRGAPISTVTCVCVRAWERACMPGRVLECMRACVFIDPSLIIKLTRHCKPYNSKALKEGPTQKCVK